MRLFEMAKLMSKLKPHIPALPDLNSYDMHQMKDRAEYAVGRYLVTFKKEDVGADKDYDVFETFYQSLATDQISPIYTGKQTNTRVKTVATVSGVNEENRSRSSLKMGSI